MSQTVTTKTYRESLRPGSFLAEEYVEEVVDRDPQRDAAEVDSRVFAFRYYDIETAEAELVGGGTAKIGAEKVNRSGWFYINAEQLTVADLTAEAGDGRYDILIGNMEGNGWDTVFRCRTGNFQPKYDDDTVVYI